MAFNSTYYLFLFLPSVFAMYFFLNKIHLVTMGMKFLVIASLFYYGYSNPNYLGLIICSMVINFLIGNIALNGSNKFSKSDNLSESMRKFSLVIGLLFNIGMLAYFKYIDFFIENYNWVLETETPKSSIILPLAISYFTFQQITYLVDSYHKNIQENNFITYCLFVTFFPQLVMGPIVRYREMMPQLKRIRNKLLNWRNLSLGIYVISIGLFKKMVIADTFALWANIGFNANTALSFFDAWGTSLCYTFQLYYDFSGYTDMAVGSALLFNIHIPINFNSPYQAFDIQDFWRRWHITLSNWLRDYLYIPLGGNRKGKIRTYVNLIITFLLGGLWHGAGWTFIVWGGLHGIALAIHRLWKRLGFKMPALFGWFFTFMFVNVAWVFFRANTCADAIKVLTGMIGVNGVKVSVGFVNLYNYINPWSVIKLTTDGVEDILMSIYTIEFLILFGLIAFLLPNTMQMIQYVKYDGKFVFKPTLKHALLFAFLTYKSLMMFMGDNTPSEFLYYQF